MNEFSTNCLGNKKIWDVEKLSANINTGNHQFSIHAYANKIRPNSSVEDFLDFLTDITKDMRGAAHPLRDPKTGDYVTSEGMEAILETYGESWMKELKIMIIQVAHWRSGKTFLNQRKCRIAKKMIYAYWTREIIHIGHLHI